MKKNIFVLLLVAFLLVFAVNLVAETSLQEDQTEIKADSQKAGRSAKTIAALVAAAFAFGFGALGAGAAIGRVGSAAMGAIAEKPSIAGQALVFVALAEGIVMFGFITALMILGKI